MYNDFITMDSLATFAGLITAVTLIVQFSKSIIKNKFSDVYVRLYTLFVSLILTFIFGKSGIDTGVKGIVLTFINAIIITMTSIGTYETISDPRAQKQKRGN